MLSPVWQQTVFGRQGSPGTIQGLFHLPPKDWASEPRGSALQYRMLRLSLSRPAAYHSSMAVKMDDWTNVSAVAQEWLFLNADCWGSSNLLCCIDGLAVASPLFSRPPSTGYWAKIVHIMSRFDFFSRGETISCLNAGGIPRLRALLTIWRFSNITLV